MANEYLVGIHFFLSEKIKEAEQSAKIADQKGDRASRQFYNGKLYELKQIRKYISENFNLETQVYY